MNILLCGLGSIGKRHARLLRTHFPQHHLFALRTYKGQETNDLGIPELRSWDEADRQSYHAAFITNPTALHVEYALECAGRKMNLFIEKPVSLDLHGLDKLLALVEKNRLASYLAYPLRFHPVIRELKTALKGRKILHARAVCGSYLPDWRPGQNHKESYSSLKAAGGGVLLDLSHEIDLASHLLGEVTKISGCLGRVADITVDAEDSADLLVSHGSVVTNLHLDYFSRRPHREFEVDTDAFRATADLIRNTLTVADQQGEKTREFPFERDDMYRDQLAYFLQNLDNMKMDNNLFDASRLFQKIVALRESF